MQSVINWKSWPEFAPGGSDHYLVRMASGETLISFYGSAGNRWPFVYNSQVTHFAELSDITDM